MIGKVAFKPPTDAGGPHTPGPWKTITPGHGLPTEYLSVQVGADEMYTTLEMRPADARLVAASPDLLAACEAMLAAWADPNALDARVEALRAARTAVAKAKGATP